METGTWFCSASINTSEVKMRFYPTRGRSGHLHVIAEVRKKALAVCVPLIQQLQGIPELSFSSAPCPFINTELTLSFKRLNTLHLSLIWQLVWQYTVLPHSEVFYLHARNVCMYNCKVRLTVKEECTWFDTTLKTSKYVYVVVIFFTLFSLGLLQVK